MARPDLEIAKFTENSDGNTAVRVIGGSDSFKQPEGTDAITFEYPSATVEIIRFRDGGTLGSILKSLQITYTNASKVNIESVEVL